MEVIEIPFNHFVGIKKADKPEYLLMLEERPEHKNHLTTIHASAQFTLAEASSGSFLVKEFSAITDIIPVVRKAEIKFRKPAMGKIYSLAKFLSVEKEEIIETLSQKGRALFQVEVTLFNEEQTPVMQSIFEWFLTQKH